MRMILPSIGARFTCTSKTFMKTEMRWRGPSPRASSGGGVTSPMALMRPSAGEMTSPSNRRGALGIAKKIGAPEGEHEGCPSQCLEAGDEQQESRCKKYRDEAIAVAVDR